MSLTVKDRNGITQTIKTSVGSDGEHSFVEGLPWNYQITSGHLDGYSVLDEFGHNPLITTTSDPEDIWEGGGTYPFSTSADIVSISSSDAGDTQDIKITGMGADGNQVVQTITLSGQTRVALDTDLLRIIRMENEADAGGDLSGTVYCYSGTANTAGVPSGGSVVKARIENGYNQTLMAIITIPLGKVGFLFRGEAGISYSAVIGAGNNFANAIYQSRRWGKVFKVKKFISLVSGATSIFQEARSFPDPIPALTDVKITCQEVSEDVGMWATLDVLLVDEEKLSAAYLVAIGQPTST